MSEIRVIGGRQMVQSDHPDGHWIPVAAPYDAAGVRWQADRDRAQWAAEREARFAAAIEDALQER